MDEDQWDWARGMVLLDRTNESAERDISYPFALDELIGRQTGDGGPSVCHLWRHPRAFVIGSRDSRLPGSAHAVRRLQEEGYSTLVRHSGGAAVPLDSGVVNVSLILPGQGVHGQDIYRDFDRMYALIRRAVASLGAEADKGEVKGSYCPGDYDLHIQGLKFCGIAQRRQLRATIIQAFVLAEGSAQARAQRVRAFYEQAAIGAEPGSYPLIEAGRMTSLEERSLVGERGSRAFAQAVIEALQASQTPQEAAASARLFRMPEESSLLSMCEQLKQRYAVLESE